MKSTSDEKPTRRQEILNAAFSRAFDNDGWSLSEVAEAVGISKAAIFRHFKNRAEIEKAMNDQFCEDLRDAIESAEYSANGLRVAGFGFFRAQPGYLFHLMSHSFGKGGTHREIIDYLVRESPRMAAFMSSQKNSPKNISEQIFIDVIKNIVTIIIICFHDDCLGRFENDLTNILAHGFPELTTPTDKRFEELEEICRIDESEIQNENKIFEAIANSIREYGIEGVTIGQIAERTGMAKSSLYFYYRNKEEMLAELLRGEMGTIIDLNARRAQYGKTLAEQIFILMLIQANYLLQKPDILPVFNWIRYETIRQTRRVRPTETAKSTLRGLYRLEELSSEHQLKHDDALIYLKWATILSTSTVGQGKGHGMDDEAIRKNIRAMFKSMMNGDVE